MHAYMKVRQRCVCHAASAKEQQETCLAQFALPVLKHCLAQRPLHKEQLHQALLRLLPTGGWPLGTPMASARALQQAELAHHLLQQQQEVSP